MESTNNQAEEDTQQPVTETNQEGVSVQEDSSTISGTHQEEEKKGGSALKIGDNSLESMLKLFKDIDPSKMNTQQRKYYQELEQMCKEHKFWGTQPVPQVKDQFERAEKAPKDGPISTQALKDVRKEPLVLPPGFEWSNLDLNDEQQLQELYEFLRDNYVEDSDNTFRFDY